MEVFYIEGCGQSCPWTPFVGTYGSHERAVEMAKHLTTKGDLFTRFRVIERKADGSGEATWDSINWDRTPKFEPEYDHYDGGKPGVLYVSRYGPCIDPEDELEPSE